MIANKILKLIGDMRRKLRMTVGLSKEVRE